MYQNFSFFTWIITYYMGTTNESSDNTHLYIDTTALVTKDLDLESYKTNLRYLFFKKITKIIFIRN